MTFAVVLASRSAIWTCADRQLTDRNDAKSGRSGVKITGLETKDGVALLAYAGIGRVRDTQVSRWVYRTLCGHNMPLEWSLGQVCNRAHKRLAPHVQRAGQTHFFIASAIRDGLHFIYEIDLRITPPTVIRREPRTRSNVMIMVSGIGASYALPGEQARLKRIARMIKQYERDKVSGEFIAAELAALNRAVSTRAFANGDQTISPESVAMHWHPKGRKAARLQWCFDATGKSYRDPTSHVPVVSCGMPMSELSEVLWGDVERRLRALPPGSWPEDLGSLVPDMATTNARLAKIPDTPDDEFH
jgi:hypothetical protein